MLEASPSAGSEFSPRIPIRGVIAFLGSWGLVLALFAEFASATIEVSAFALIVLLVAAVAWQLTERRPKVAQWFTVLAVLGLVVLAGSRAGEALPALLCIPVGLAGVVISAPAAIGIALAETALVALAPGSIGVAPDPAGRFLVLTAVWVTMALLLGVVQRARRLEGWLWRYLESSQQALTDARDRRAELEEMRGDWQNATRQLALANERLSTLRVRAEQARRSKAEFAATVSHEFRTPLNIIIGLVDLIIEAPHLYPGRFPPKALEHLQAVHRNCKHLAGMIDDVLDLSRVEAGHMVLRQENVDLAEVVRSAVAVVQPLIDRKDLHLELQLPDVLPRICCDRIRIRQVILNLLSNAARLTDRGGISVGVEKRSHHVVISVADTGPGMEADVAERIFEPFQRGVSATGRDVGGSGLGLSISKEFVQLHGGRMWIESEVGRGSVFYIELPLAQPGGRASPPQRWIRQDWVWREHAFRTGAAGLGDQALMPRIVVLDETGDLRSELARYHADLQIVEVADLPGAADDLSGTPADLLVVNASSVDRLWPLVSTAQQHVRDTPIIGCCYPPQTQHALEAGALNYLTKPVSRANLAGVIGAVGAQVRRVLVLDDDGDARELLTYLLRSYDERIRVTEAANGEEALRVLQADPPDLILVDLLMPGMDGWQFLGALASNEKLANIPAVIVSAQDAVEGLPTSSLLVATMGEGLSVRQLLRGSRDLAGSLLRPD